MDKQPQNPAQRSLIQTLQSLQRCGVTHLPKPVPLTNDPSAAPTLGKTECLNGGEKSVTQPIKAATNLDKQAELHVVRKEVDKCTMCTELAGSRTQTVFGVGNPDARLCFLGEAPGADEDRQGEPFVGRAGQLLTKIIEACTMKREDVYILNILKCRPPGNRNPSPQESENCSDFLHQQLDIIQPEYICCLGSIAATNLLDTKLSIGKLRGKFHLYQGIKVIATYHPAYLLRNPSAKKQVWEDMKMLMREMGIAIPGQS